MALSKIGLSLNPTFSKLLVGVGIGVLFLPTHSNAIEAQVNNTNIGRSDNSSLLLAQRIPSYCRSEESTFLTMETRSFYISICGGDNPNSYVGVEKARPRNRIRLPLRDFDPQGTYFEAVNGNYTYILAQTPRGKFLTVTQGTRELLRETVSGWE